MNNKPQSRIEEILQSIIDNTDYDKDPQSRVEDLVLQIKEQGGGGSGVPTGGTTGQVLAKKSDADRDVEWKTVEGTGIVDTEMSDTSENAVQNKVIKSYIDTAKEQAMSITSGGRSNIGTPTETGYMRIKDGDHTGTEQINIMYNLATSDNTLSLMYETSGDFEHDKEFVLPTTDYVDSKVGDLITLTTTDKTSAVAAINELKFDVDGLGESFRIKSWATTFNPTITIPNVSSDIDNTSIPSFDFRISGQEAIDFQVIGLLGYEVFDESSKRINCFPVCQFTGEGQKLLRVRMMCGGTTNKVAKKINAWVLLIHRQSN